MNLDADARAAAEDRRRVLRRFFTPEGRLMTIPVRHVKRGVVLDHLVQRFDLGVVYPEAEVVALLKQAHPDHAALRRYLVEDGFLAREDGRYWRCGGTVDADDDLGGDHPSAPTAAPERTSTSTSS